MLRIGTLALLGGTILMGRGVLAAEPAMRNTALPVYECRRVERDLSLSGKADDPLWREARPMELAGPIDGKPGRYRTTARMLYNDRFLYLAFRCEDERVWGTFTQRDAEIYTEECVEAFLCPSGMVRQYYEINVSPRNTVFDAFILNGRPWNGPRVNFRGLKEYTCDGLVTKTHIDGPLDAPGAKGWSAEFAIPFASLIGPEHLTPRPGDRWRMNLFRIDSPEKGKLELYSWSPTEINDFHCPWRFGTLVFR
ncbi:MAG: carbohydrate-binding family 9-like protein [Thermoguttaceae bacterium]|jgi:hypothetical protein|nr:carbohydrate-binding family 9-like protein [Thermoguttaceae bacterium]